MLKTEVITDAVRFCELTLEWDVLLERASANSASVAPLWQKSWWEVFGASEGRRLRVFTVRDGERLIGLAPLLARTHWYRPGIPLRRLELLASGEPQADETCSDYNGVVAERGREVEVCERLVDALSRGSLGGWDELLMPAMSADDPLAEGLARLLRENGHSVSLDPCSTSPFIELPATWEQYLASLSSSTRRLLKTTQRDLERWSEGDVRFERAHTEADVERGSDILMSLHGDLWRSTETGYGGVFASERFCAFHKKVMHELRARDALELCWLSVCGEPIAALYNFVWNNKVYHYQSGRRVDLPKQIRAGIAIHAYAIRSAIENGCTEYDFLPGDSRYKDQLALGARQLVQLRSTNLPVVEVARQVALRGLSGARAMKRGLRQIMQAPVEV